MNIAEYISSGILESYVMGLLSPEETMEVQQMMLQHKEIKDEVVAIEEALISHAIGGAPALSEKVKFEVLSVISPLPISKIINHPASAAKAQGGALKYLAAASITLFLMSAAINFYLFSNLKTAMQRIAALNTEKIQLASEFNVQQTKYKTIESNMAILQSPYNKPVMMKGLPVSPGALAMIYWNTQTHEVFLNVHQLPPPPEGKQYQLWALAGGIPINAGVFDVTSDSLNVQKMKVIDSAEAFAVTLENAGGSPSPTLTAMYLMGTI